MMSGGNCKGGKASFNGGMKLMFVSSTKGGETAKEIIAAPQKLQRSEFSRILNKQIADSVKPADAAVSAQRLPIGNEISLALEYVLPGAISKHNPSVVQDSEKPELLLLGSLSKSDPTVSDLMIKHPVYGKDCWKIVYSSMNRHKDYTAIPSGSRIY